MRRYVTFDWAIKSILRNKANFAVLEGFVSVLLGEDIKIDSILESETNKEREDEKQSRVDMLARDSKGDLLLFEVQYVRELDYFQRMLYETSKIVTETVRKGGVYSDVKKVYSIHIVYFDLGDGDDCIYKGSTKFVGMRNNKELGLTKNQQKQFRVATVSDIFPTYYIIKLCNFKGEAKTEIEEWMRFLKDGDIDDTTTTRGLVEAKKSLNMMMLPDKELKRYNWYISDLSYQASIFQTAIIEGLEQGKEMGVEMGIEIGIKKGIAEGMEKGIAEGMEKGIAEGMEKGIAEGMEKGIAEGAAQKNIENAKRMKEIGIATEQIAMVTGLSEEEIARL